MPLPLDPVEVSQRLKLYRSIFVQTDSADVIHNALDEMRLDARLNRGDEQLIQPIVGPSGSGKSEALKRYIAGVIREGHPDGIRPVVRVKVSPKATRRQFQVDRLIAYGDLDAENGDEGRLRRRAGLFAERFGTEIEAYEEFHHLIDRDTGKTAWTVAEMVKVMADDGLFGPVIIGVDDKMGPLLAANNQMLKRCRNPIILPTYNTGSDDDLDTIKSFISSIETQMVEKGITTELSELDRDDWVPVFADQCAGIRGDIYRVIRAALKISLERGETVVSIDSLCDGVDLWLVALGIAKSNRFRSLR